RTRSGSGSTAAASKYRPIRSLARRAPRPGSTSPEKRLATPRMKPRRTEKSLSSASAPYRSHDLSSSLRWRLRLGSFAVLWLTHSANHPARPVLRTPVDLPAPVPWIGGRKRLRGQLHDLKLRSC